MHKNRVLYHLGIFGTAAVSVIILTLGCAVVRVNCHNTVSSEKMVLFELETGEEGTLVKVMDREFFIPAGEKKAD